MEGDCFIWFIHYMNNAKKTVRKNILSVDYAALQQKK